MSSECLVCLEKIIINGEINVWMCNHCNVEIHKQCKNEWDVANDENNTCPHCRREEELVSAQELAREIINIETDNTNTDNTDNNVTVIYRFIYCKVILVMFVICFLFAIVSGFGFLLLNELSYGYSFNYTALR